MPMDLEQNCLLFFENSLGGNFPVIWGKSINTFKYASFYLRIRVKKEEKNE